MSRGDLEAAAEAAAAHVELAEAIRGDVFVWQFVKAVKDSKRYQFDVEALSDEIGALLGDGEVRRAFDLEGSQGLKDANEELGLVRGARSSLVSLNRGLRKIGTPLRQQYRIVATYVRTQVPEIRDLTQKAQEDLVAVALREVYQVLADIDRLSDEVKEALSHLHDKTRAVDAWFDLHRQYVFLTLSRRDRDRDREEEAPTRLPRRTRR